MHPCIKTFLNRFVERLWAWGREGVRAWGREGVRAWGREGVRAWGREGVRAWGREGVRAWGREGVIALHIRVRHCCGYVRAYALLIHMSRTSKSDFNIVLCQLHHLPSLFTLFEVTIFTCFSFSFSSSFFSLFLCFFFVLHNHDLCSGLCGRADARRRVLCSYT